MTSLRRPIATATRATPTTEDWRARALCAESVTSPEDDIWFSDNPADIARAKTICGRCPVRNMCRDEILTQPRTSRRGVWGGRNYSVKTSGNVQDRMTARREMYEQGFTDEQIADAEGSNRRSITEWRRANELSLNPGGNDGRTSPWLRNDADFEAKRWEMYGAGMSDIVLAEALNVSRSGIVKWRRRNNLPPNRGAQIAS